MVSFIFDNPNIISVFVFLYFWKILLTIFSIFIFLLERLVLGSVLSVPFLGFKLPSLSSLKIPIRAYANGGFPEDGLFFANHNELLGKFNNGKTAVANNLQIQAGIEEASYRGYMRAIQDSGMNINNSQIDVHVHTDEGTVIDRIEQKIKQTGVFPFTIPT